MSRKLNFIPNFESYDWIRNQMNEDLKYRLESRNKTTSFGRPLYERINVQIIMTQECPYRCPFCLERQHPMAGNNNFKNQIESLKKILDEHPNARLTITGGEPTLYLEQVRKIADTFNSFSNKIFLSLNTAGYDSNVVDIIDNINLSFNDYVHPDIKQFPNATFQTVLNNGRMDWKNISEIIENTNMDKFSFRFLSGLNKSDYPIDIWKDIQENAEVHTFRVGDFFVYATFDYKGKHARITLGDMYQQTHNNYENGYSNIIIHPDGRIGTNWR